MKRIAVIWARYGPYHLARLREAAALLGENGLELTGIETARRDGIYQWDLVGHDDGFERCIVFPDSNYAELRAGQISRGIDRALTQISPAAVAINGWSVSEAVAALNWCRRNRRVAILMSESKEDEAARSWWKESLKSWRVRKFDAALVGGEPHKAYAKKLGMSESRIFLGYDAVDNQFFEKGVMLAGQRDAELRAEFNLPARYFYCNTRFLLRKNIDGLLRAYRLYRVEAGAAAWGLVITGSGETEAQNKQLARDLGLTDVVWPGFVQYDVLPTYYGLASAFIHPAKSEPWGLVVNEAAASGLPLLVARPTGSRYELLREGENGFLFDPFDDRDIARVMLAVSRLTEEARGRMGSRSREIVSGYGPRRFAEGLWQAFLAGYQARHGVPYAAAQKGCIA